MQLVRIHRLWEVFLVNHLGYSWEDVHEEAEKLEHAASPLLMEKLDRFLGYPEMCPHGRTIPGRKDQPLQEGPGLAHDGPEQVREPPGLMDGLPDLLVYLSLLDLQYLRLGYARQKRHIRRSVPLLTGGVVRFDFLRLGIVPAYLFGGQIYALRVKHL